MVRKIEGLPANVVAVEAHGEVTGDDYEKVIVPAIESALKEQEKIRFLYHVGPDFTGYTAAAIWDDMKIGAHHWKAFERCAVVTDVRWISDTVRAFRFLMPCPVMVFRNDEMARATAWLTS
jgi:hypothetical protein